MALELRQQLKLSQQLVMTPQLQQAIKLLQLSRVELLETVQQELLENPFLEEAPANEPVAPQDQEEARHEKPQDEVYDEDLSRNADWEEYLGEFASTPRTSQGRELEIAEEISPLEARYSAKPTLEGHLLWQLHLSTLTDAQKEIGEITSRILTKQLKELEEDGMIRREVDTSGKIKVEYSLTDRGHSILPVLYSMAEWGARNQFIQIIVPKVEEAESSA